MLELIIKIHIIFLISIIFPLTFLPFLMDLNLTIYCNAIIIVYVVYIITVSITTFIAILKIKLNEQKKVHRN